MIEINLIKVVKNVENVIVGFDILYVFVNVRIDEGDESFEVNILINGILIDISIEAPKEKVEENG